MGKAAAWVSPSLQRIRADANPDHSERARRCRAPTTVAEAVGSRSDDTPSGSGGCVTRRAEVRGGDDGRC
jgi:hypothetical protein